MEQRLVRLGSLVVVSTFAVLAFGCASKPPPEPVQQQQLAQALTPPARLEPKEPLPGAAREILRSRMANHARSMGDLVSAIIVLDYPTIRRDADAIASDVNLSRPLSADATELNTLLPEKFFAYQDDLRTNARALSAAADKLDAFAVAEAYGRLAESCVRCHATYRAGR